EIHKRVGWPQPLFQLSASNQLTRPFQERYQHLERLLRQSVLVSARAELRRLTVELEFSEANLPGGLGGNRHPETLLGPLLAREFTTGLCSEECRPLMRSRLAQGPKCHKQGSAAPLSAPAHFCNFELQKLQAPMQRNPCWGP